MALICFLLFLYSEIFPDMSNNNNSVSNLDFLKSFCEGDEARMKKYIGMYLNSGPQHIKTMEEALKAEDFTTLQKTAHMFKANIKFMGIESGGKIIEQIEHNCNANSGLDSLPVLMQELSAICNRSFSELKQ